MKDAGAAVLANFKESEQVDVLLLRFHAETNASFKFLPGSQETPRLKVKKSF